MKKILISLGGIATIATPLIVSFHADRHEAKKIPKVPKKTIIKSVIPESEMAPIIYTTVQEDIKNILNLHSRTTKVNIFKDPIVVDKITNIIIKFVKNGLNGITFEEVDDLLKTFNVDDKTKNLIYPLFSKIEIKDPSRKVIDLKLIKMLFNTGLSSLRHEENVDSLRGIQKLISSILNIDINLNDDLMKKLLATGFANKDEFINDVFAVLSKIPQLKSTLDTAFFGEILSKILKDTLSAIYEELSGVLGHGLLNITSADIKEIIQWNGLLDVPNLTKIIGMAKALGLLPNETSQIINKIVLVDEKLDLVNTITNFVKADELAPIGWTTFNKITNIWSSLRVLNESGSLDAIVDIIPTLFQQGLTSLTSKQINQLANIVDFVVDYDVTISKVSFEKLKEALIRMFDDKFVDAKNTRNIDLTALNNAKKAQNAISIAKNIVAFDAKKIYKKTIVRPLAIGHYSNPAKTLIDYKKRLVEQLDDLYLSKDKHQEGVNDDSIDAINDANSLEKAKKIADTLNSNGLYTKYTELLGFMKIPGKLATSFDPKLPEFNEVTPIELANYKEILKPLFQGLFKDQDLKHPISTNSIDDAKSLADVITRFDILAKSLYVNEGIKFVPNIKKIIKNNPFSPAEHEESAIIDEFKKDAVSALAHLYTDKEHLIPVDTTNIENAKTIAEIKAAFLALTTSGHLYDALYDGLGNVVTNILSVSVPSKYSLLGPLDESFLKRRRHKTHGNLISMVHKKLPHLKDFLFNGISNFKNDQAKLKEFVPNTLLPILQVLLSAMNTGITSVSKLEPLIASLLTPIIEKISKMD